MLSSYPFNFWTELNSANSYCLSLAALIAIKSDSFTFFMFIYHLPTNNTTIIKNRPKTTGIAIQLFEFVILKDCGSSKFV